ncbi:MAG TPA: glycosyltransferase [Acidimicrobiales bacterium]
MTVVMIQTTRDTTRVTVVVPTRNSSRTIERCLQSVRAQRHPDVELIVVDNGSSDGTPALATRHADLVLTHGPERSAQRNRGAARGQGELVAFIDSDMVLTPDVLSEATELFATDPQLGAVIVEEEAFGTGRFARCRELEKQLCIGDESVEAARIFRRAAFEAVGGYDEQLNACEDWDLADRVAAAGWATGRIRARIRHDEGHVSLLGAFRKKRYYGRAAADWSPDHRSRHRRRRPLSLLAAIARTPAPTHVRVGLAVLKCAEWAGFAIGVLQRKAARARLRRRGSATPPRASR